MSRELLANGDEHSSERGWRWTRSRSRTSVGHARQPEMEIVDQKLGYRSSIKQIISTPEDDLKRKKSRSKIKKLPISELADPSLIEPPKVLSQESVTWKSKSTTSLSDLARRGSWILRSRSPSPKKRTAAPSTTLSKPEKAIILQDTESPSETPTDDVGPLLRTPSSTSLGRSKRPLSAIFTRSASSPQIATTRSVRKVRSIERLPTADPPPPVVPDLPTATRAQLLQPIPIEGGKKKDELWNAFRNLDQDYSKFANKPNSFKPAVIRTSLLPFIRQYADHRSNWRLRVEDLDRRVNILNKWWLGLLEMISARNGYAIAPSDRPTILDGLTGIMQRSEWRLTATSLVPSRHSLDNSTSSLSLTTSGAWFLAESVLKNTRIRFEQNLLAQMNFAVDRMSLRTVAASVVAFCGKAITYAFFFCPGVADVLVKLWDLPSTHLRRVLDEAGVPRNTNLKSTTCSVAGSFPNHLAHLCFTSLPALSKTLRNRSTTQYNLDHVNWDGPWIGRWSGRDSDLFFCFVKHYHNLVFEMLGENCTDQERLCAPGAVLVHGQMLAVMDATLQVHKNPHAKSQAVTLDDILGPEASAATLTGRAPNTARAMAENRMIILLRGMLSDAYPAVPAVKLSFAALFGNLLKATTKKTAISDADACFMLCDFLEESMLILARFFRNSEDPAAFLDWPFWLDVLKRLGESNNTMTEVRMYSLIYSLWGYISKDESKKRDLCLGWLLNEDYAYQQFNHWCPMIRAYYHRLLIWRVAQHPVNTPASMLDMEIYTALLSLLQKLFSQYLHKSSTAEQAGLPLPSTTPSSPAPGRRLLIIRDDSAPLHTAVLTSFLASATDHSTLQRLTSFDTLNKLAETPEPLDKTSKKRFSFLRNLNPFSNPVIIEPISVDSPERSPPSSYHTPCGSTGSSTPGSSPSPPATPVAPTPDLVPNRLFKFSLEWVDRPHTYRVTRKLEPPRLPATSQIHIPKQIAEAIILGDSAPSRKEESASRYIGSSLAEWSILINEWACFADRRRHEGVASHRIETPQLGVETFRKPIG